MVILRMSDSPSEASFAPPPKSAVAGKSIDWVIGMLVPPVIVGLVAARTISDGLTQLGLVSEQLLQGERLPNLHIPPLQRDS